MSRMAYYKFWSFVVQLIIVLSFIGLLFILLIQD